MRHWSWGHVSGFELFGCVHPLGHAHWSDPSILEVDIDVVARITKPYAMGAFAQVHAELSDWYERYRWRTVQEASEKLKEKVRSDLSPEIVDEQMA